MKQGIVIDKEYKADYEAGSGSLHIPILGDLFPKLFSSEMKPINRWFLIVRTDALYRYEVTKEVYEEALVGDKVTMGTDKYGMPEVILD